MTGRAIVLYPQRRHRLHPPRVVAADDEEDGLGARERLAGAIAPAVSDVDVHAVGARLDNLHVIEPRLEPGALTARLGPGQELGDRRPHLDRSVADAHVRKMHRGPERL